MPNNMHILGMRKKTIQLEKLPAIKERQLGMKLVYGVGDRLMA